MKRLLAKAILYTFTFSAGVGVGLLTLAFLPWQVVVVGATILTALAGAVWAQDVLERDRY